MNTDTGFITSIPMRAILMVCLAAMISRAQGQVYDYQELLDSAKALFKNEIISDQAPAQKPDYQRIANILELVVDINPNSSEARYFLAYTYSRMSLGDANGIPKMDLSTLYKTSMHLEKVIELSPKYAGEIVILDPYSKLTAEWGSMAMSYLYNNKIDSAKWALMEGRKRGGFGDYHLEVAKNTLNACHENAILISSGDNFSFPLLYVQYLEDYRKDISVVDISLLNSSWYPSYLSNNKIVSFDLPNEVLDTISYKKWSDTLITINDFSWTVNPTYYNQYLLRGDLIFLSLLKKNEFARDLYFTVGFYEDQRLSLKEHIRPLVLVDELNVNGHPLLNDKEYKDNIFRALSNTKHINSNSQDNLYLLDIFRRDILIKINHYISDGEKSKAYELAEILNMYGREDKYPYQSESLETFARYLRSTGGVGF
ncbi:MAG: hypothetical protein AAF741_19695 [Bacteroidota bacterium]